jgi:hypothetical protein
VFVQFLAFLLALPLVFLLHLLFVIIPGKKEAATDIADAAANFLRNSRRVGIIRSTSLFNEKIQV